MMAHPVLMPRDDGRYELVARYHEVPAGFVTDGASIPRLLWRVLGHPFEADTIGAAKAKLFYFGVRMFGGRHYNNKKGTT